MLSEHPLFVEALAAARNCDDTVAFKTIVTCSEDLRVFEHALRAGAKFEELEAPAVVVPDSCAGAGDLASSAFAYLFAESAIAREAIDRAVAARGGADLECEVAVFSNIVRERLVYITLKVAVSHPRLPDRMTTECSGSGHTSDEAIACAVDAFNRGVIPVLLDGLIDESLSGGEVDIENIAGWRVYIGQGLQVGRDIPAGFDHVGLLDAVLEAWQGAVPPWDPQQPHWIDIFCLYGASGPHGCEVVVDNKPWQPGTDLLRGWQWPWDGGESYGYTAFLMLRPAPGQQPGQTSVE